MLPFTVSPLMVRLLPVLFGAVHFFFRTPRRVCEVLIDFIERKQKKTIEIAELHQT